MNTPQSSEDAETGIPTWKVELATAACLFALGLVVAYTSWQLGAGWRDDGPGPGYFPFYIGALICIATGLVIKGVFSGRSRSRKVFVTYAQLKLVATVLLPMVGYVVAVQAIGLYVGSALFVAAFMVVIGKYTWLKSGLIALAFAALAFLMFEVWFKVPLYKGMLNPLRFLGY
jgi:Tripartite tricarboxylate transporter TctB family